MRILLATAFGNTATSALGHAIYLSRRLPAELLLLHATAPRLGGDLAAAFQAGETRLRALREEASRAGARVSATLIQRIMEPDELVVASARETGVALIVMGSGGPAGRLGSVAEQVASRVRAPLWLSGSDAVGAPRRIALLRGETGDPVPDAPSRLAGVLDADLEMCDGPVDDILRHLPRQVDIVGVAVRPEEDGDATIRLLRRASERLPRASLLVVPFDG